MGVLLSANGVAGTDADGGLSLILNFNIVSTPASQESRAENRREGSTDP